MAVCASRQRAAWRASSSMRFRPAREHGLIEVRAIIRVDQRGDLTADDHGDGDAEVVVAQGDEVERTAVITEERGVMHFGARALIDDALEIGNHVEGERHGTSIARRGLEAGERPALEVAAADDEHGAARRLARGFGGEDVEELRQRLSFVEAAERGDEPFHRREHGLALVRLPLVRLAFEGGVTLGLRGFAFGLGGLAFGLGGITFGLGGVAGGQFGFVARGQLGDGLFAGAGDRRHPGCARWPRRPAAPDRPASAARRRRRWQGG